MSSFSNSMVLDFCRVDNPVEPSYHTAHVRPHNKTSSTLQVVSSPTSTTLRDTSEPPQSSIFANPAIITAVTLGSVVFIGSIVTVVVVVVYCCKCEFFEGKRKREKYVTAAGEENGSLLKSSADKNQSRSSSDELESSVTCKFWQWWFLQVHTRMWAIAYVSSLSTWSTSTFWPVNT